MNFKIGQTVKIIKISDETGDKKYLNKIGVVKYFDYDCGCGQSYPDDPMIGVKFADGEIEEFWKEEISYYNQ